MLDQHQKQSISMRYWLLGASYTDSSFNIPLKAMEYASEFHNGMRKDKITPEYNHQMNIGHYIRSIIRSVKYPAETLAVAFLHDLCEDYDIGFEEIETNFGHQIAHSTRLITKKYRGEKIPYDVYFGNMAKDPIASIVKGCDRDHNIGSMHGANWTDQKKQEYANEVYQYFFPMLKTARRLFPEQEMAYENIKHSLTGKVQAIRNYLPETLET